MSLGNRLGTRIYVGRLSGDVRERDLERFFKNYGHIREILLKNGFGFVEFDDYRDADDAVYELNGKELCGERVIIEHARGSQRRGGYFRGGGTGRDTMRRRAGWLDKYGPPTRTQYRVRVENLSTRVSWQDLKDFMRQAGEVTYADAHKTHRNEGVVEFSSYGDVKKAMEKLQGTELNGRRIKLVEESNRAGRSYSRSRSRSRSPGSRSRSRSRSRSHHSSRSRSPSLKRSRSKERKLSKERSRSPSQSPKRNKSQERQASKERSPSRSRSRSRSPLDEKNDIL